MMTDGQNIWSAEFTIFTWAITTKPSLHVVVVAVVQSLSRVWLFATPWTVARQAPLSMGFSRQDYWSGSPFPSPGDLPDAEIEPVSPALVGRLFTTEPPGKFYLVAISPYMANEGDILIHPSPWVYPSIYPSKWIKRDYIKEHVREHCLLSSVPSTPAFPSWLWCLFA